MIIASVLTHFLAAPAHLPVRVVNRSERHLRTNEEAAFDPRDQDLQVISHAHATVTPVPERTGPVGLNPALERQESLALSKAGVCLQHVDDPLVLPV